MKGACPLKTSPDWVASKEALGEDKTYELWMISTEGVVPEPVGGAFYFYTKQNPVQAAELLDKYVPNYIKSNLKYTNNILDLISMAEDAMYEDAAFKEWLGKNDLLGEVFEGDKIKRTDIQEQLIEQRAQTLAELSAEVQDFKPVTIDPVKLQDEIISNDITLQYARVFRTREYDLPYNVITSSTAKMLLEKAYMSYNNESVFEYNGAYYYVSDRITPDTDFVKMALPALKTLSSKVINTNYDKLAETAEGQAIIEKVAARYPKITDRKYLGFREKVLLEALEYDATIAKTIRYNQDPNTTITPQFKQVINTIMSLARSEFKKRLGKVSSEKIQTNTSFYDVANILSGNLFKKPEERVTASQMTEASKNAEIAKEELLASIRNDPNKQRIDQKFDDFITNLQRRVSGQQRELRKKKYANLRAKLSDPTTGPFLTDIAFNLKAFRKDLSPEELEFYEKQSDNTKARNLVNSLFLLEKTLTKMSEDAASIKSSNMSTEEKLAEVEQYEKLFKDWLQFIKEAEDQILKKLDRNSFIYGFVSRLDVLANQGLKDVKDIQEDGAVKEVTGFLKSFTDKMQTKINAEIERVSNIKGDEKIKQAELKRLNEEKEKYFYDEGKVRALFKGELGDSEWFTNMFISHSSDPDPIIGTFSLYLKRHLTNVVTKSVMRGKMFVEDIREQMSKEGMTNVDFEKQWKPYTMIDTDEKGNEVIAFLQATKGWRYDKADMRRRIIDARKANDKELLEKLYEERAAMEKVFNREFKPEFYAPYDKLRKEDIEAYDALKQADDDIEDFRSENMDLFEAFENNDYLLELQLAKERLYSIYDENNQLKDEKGQRIAKALTEHREATKDFFEAIPKQNAFQKSVNAWAQLIQDNPEYAGVQLFDDAGKMTPEYKDIIIKWSRQQLNIRHTDEFYQLIADIFKRIEDVQKELPQEYNLKDLFKRKTDILIGYKDKNGQFNPNLLPKNKRSALMQELKNIETEINKMQKKAKKIKAVSPKQLAAKKALNKAFADLAKIRYKRPTDYYLEIINNFLPTVSSNISLDYSNADEFLQDPIEIDELIEKNPRFKKWFLENHIYIQVTDPNTGKDFSRYKRLDAWSVAEPINEEGGPKYTQETTVTVNGELMTFNGVPNGKYFYYKVKDNYRTIPMGMSEEERTAKHVGKQIDNQFNYLPLNKEQAAKYGVPTSYTAKKYFRDENGELKFTTYTKSYINEDYYNFVKDSNKKTLLDKITNYHLDNQIGIEYRDRLYLDLPRFPIHELLEKAQRGVIKDNVVDRFKGIVAGAVATFSKKGREEANRLSREAGDVELGFSNPELEQDREELVVAKDVVVNPFVDKIPVKGLSNIPVNRVSYDVVGVLNLYMTQLEKQKELSKINPVAKAIIKSLENAENTMKDLNNIRGKQASKIDNFKAFLKGGKSSRLATIKSLYAREVQGQVFSEKHLDWLNKVTGAITGGAAMNYFALNLPSAIKNYWGALWQITVEAAAGEYMNMNSMRKAKVRAKKAMNEWTTRIWGGKYDTVDTRLILLMDPAQGKTEEIIGKDFSRTFARDLASLSWTFSPRKFMEMEGALQLFYSIMFFKKVQQTIDGETRDISLADAFELKDGRLVLKEGIDPTYGISYDEKGLPTLNDGLLKMQNIVHEKYKDLNGAFAKFEQPQAQQYFAYRLFAFMRRYFTAMFMHRFGKRRANYALEDVRGGYYRDAVLTVARTIYNLGRNIPYMSNEEKANFRRMLADIAHILVIAGIVALLFGYDDDDEDRFEKLRQKSGALGDEDFRLDGWLSNHALTLLIKTQAENESFIPLPGLGLNSYLDLAGTTSIAFGPTVTAAAKLLTDITMHAMPGDDETLYYQRDTGPYWYQKEGEAKIFNHFFTTAGFSGSQVQPIKGLESYEAYSRM